MPQVTMAVPMSTLRSGRDAAGPRWQTVRITTVKALQKAGGGSEVRLEPRHMQVSSVAMMRR